LCSAKTARSSRRNPRDERPPPRPHKKKLAEIEKCDAEPPNICSRSAEWSSTASTQQTTQDLLNKTRPDAELVALDTMNLWIDTTRESLQKTIEVVDLLIVNDAEARQNC